MRECRHCGHVSQPRTRHVYGSYFCDGIILQVYAQYGLPTVFEERGQGPALTNIPVAQGQIYFLRQLTLLLPQEEIEQPTETNVIDISERIQQSAA